METATTGGCTSGNSSVFRFSSAKMTNTTSASTVTTVTTGRLIAKSEMNTVLAPRLRPRGGGDAHGGARRGAQRGAHQHGVARREPGGDLHPLGFGVAHPGLHGHALGLAAPEAEHRGRHAALVDGARGDQHPLPHLALHPPL